MPNIAAVLKAEMARIARKEVRAGCEGLKKASAAQRSEVAGLKRRVQELDKQLRALSRTFSRGGVVKASSSPAAEADGNAGSIRFRAEGLASNRKRLGLSAHDFGLLVGASGQSVYWWEQGKVKPRAKYLAAIAELRGVGKREVTKRLETLKAEV
jgi:DNA-binding XRE family transcriptional regulator